MIDVWLKCNAWETHCLVYGFKWGEPASELRILDSPLEPWCIIYKKGGSRDIGKCLVIQRFCVNYPKSSQDFLHLTPVPCTSEVCVYIIYILYIYTYIMCIYNSEFRKLWASSVLWSFNFSKCNCIVSNNWVFLLSFPPPAQLLSALCSVLPLSAAWLLLVCIVI